MCGEYHTYFPVALKLENRKVVIFGGDQEAVMKVEKLLPTGARIFVISEEVEQEIEEHAKDGNLNWISRTYQPGDLEDAAIAIVCDVALGPEIRIEAEERNVMLNVLDKTELCDFIAVATFSRDGLQFGVHSSGKSAALSRRVRERLEDQFGVEYSKLVHLLGEIRPQVFERFSTFAERRAFWLETVTHELLDRIDQGEAVETIQAEILERLSNSDSYKEVSEHATSS